MQEILTAPENTPHYPLKIVLKNSALKTVSNKYQRKESKESEFFFVVSKQLFRSLPLPPDRVLSNMVN